MTFVNDPSEDDEIELESRVTTSMHGPLGECTDCQGVGVRFVPGTTSDWYPCRHCSGTGKARPRPRDRKSYSWGVRS